MFSAFLCTVTLQPITIDLNNNLRFTMRNFEVPELQERNKMYAQELD